MDGNGMNGGHRRLAETDLERLLRGAAESEAGKVWRATGMPRALLHERLFGPVCGAATNPANLD